MAGMENKVVLITGATSGIGRETAIGIARLGARVVVTGRNQQRGEDGVATIKQQSNSDKVELMLADFSEMAYVRQLAQDFQSRFDRLDVLINNVGYLGAERHMSPDGLEMNFAINHMAPFVLTHELLPLLKASAPSRVINVTGGQLGDGSFDIGNLQAEKSFVGLETYSKAKRVMMAASYQFAKRLEGTGVSLNVAYPGAAGTSMVDQLGPGMASGVMGLLMPVMKLFVKNADPAKAAVSSIYLATAAEAEGVSGKYYNTKAKVTDWPKFSTREEIGERIWQISEELMREKVPS